MALPPPCVHSRRVLKPAAVEAAQDCAVKGDQPPAVYCRAGSAANPMVLRLRARIASLVWCAIQGHDPTVLTDAQVLDFINSGLLFFTVLGSSVTLHSGLLSSRVLLDPGLNEYRLDGLGFAVDSGVAYGMLFGLPFAAFLAGARLAGAGIG